MIDEVAVLRAVARLGQALNAEAAAKEAWLAAIRALPEMTLPQRRAWRRGGKEAERLDAYRDTLVKTEHDHYDALRQIAKAERATFEGLARELASGERV